MKQYLDLCQRILDEGEWITNERTGKRCLTVINADLVYDVGAREFPLVTTRKSYWKSAVAEMLGYLRGHTSAADFRALGTKTWDANANENAAWLANPSRKGDDDMGRVYGAIGRDFGGIDLLTKVYDNLRQGIDDRGEILTFWKPDEFDQGCLRPCMFQHHFSLVGDTLHLTSYQRSCDVPLGLVANMVQVYFLLAVMAQITHKKAGKAYHKIVNAHIYEDQVELMRDQVKRDPFESPEFYMNPNIWTLEDLETWVTVDDFEVDEYQHHPPIKYPFSV